MAVHRISVWGRIAWLTGCVLAFVVGLSPAWAADYPQKGKTIQLIVGNAAGGPTDLGARIMAAGLEKDLFRIAEPIIFPMITVHIGFGGHVEDIVSFHHLLIAVAFQADLSMKYPVGAEFRIVHRLDVMEIMTIVAGGRILISCCHRLSVDGLPVNRLMVMALDAFSDDNALIIFPVLV